MTLRMIDYPDHKNGSHKHFPIFLFLFWILDIICKQVLQSNITIFTDQCLKTKFMQKKKKKLSVKTHFLNKTIQ